MDKRKVEGCLTGLILGDALGQPIEFKTMEQIQQEYGVGGRRCLSNYSFWTDDTEMTFAVIDALVSLRNPGYVHLCSDDVIGRVFARNFIKWLDHPGFAPGDTCMRSISILQLDGEIRWSTSSNLNRSKTCGAVMRVAPIGLFFAEAIAPELDKGCGPVHDDLFRVCKIQALITHNNPIAWVWSMIAAYAVALVYNEHRDFMKHINAEFRTLKLPDIGIFLDELEVVLGCGGCISDIGEGWDSDEAVVMALYSVIKSGPCVEAALITAANHGGDSDTVACIAGGIAGTLYPDNVPYPWLQKLQLGLRSILNGYVKKIIDNF